MNQVVWRLYLPFVFFALLLTNWARAGSDPAFWVAEGERARVYLLGSMHFGTQDFFPLPNSVEQAFAASPVLAVEVDIANIAPSRAMQALLRLGQLPGKQTLSSVLSADEYARLAAVCEHKGLPVSVFDRFQPWFVALQLVESEIRQSRLRQDLGIDLYFLKRAGDRRVDELESLEGQLALFAGMGPAEQRTFLRQTLDDLANSRDYLDVMSAAWRTGDVKALESALVQPFRERPAAKGLYQTVFLDRNRAMTTAVERYLAGAEDVFFVVGAGHMVGADGVISLLKARGHNVKRVQ